jgi:hypothetical protein
VNGARDIGEYLIKLVKDKTITKPPPPPVLVEAPKIEDEAANGAGEEATKSPEIGKVEGGDKPTISEKDHAVPAEAGAVAEVPSK